MPDSTSRPISVVIPTYNRANALEFVLPSYDDDRLVDSVVVVDDGSTDQTAGVVKRFQAAARTKVRLISHASRLGVQAARMTGVHACRTDWVLFGEDDVLLGQDYCSKLYEQAGQLGADAIAGRLIPIVDTQPVPGGDVPCPCADGNVFDPIYFEGRFHLRCRYPLRAPYLHAVALIRRRLLEECGFDPRYGGNAFREETDFYLTASAQGASLFFTPDTQCWHLRGPLARTGGQRDGGVNYLRAEWFGFVNTYKLVKKHRNYLTKVHRVFNSPGTYVMTRYLWHRLCYVLGKAFGNEQLFLRRSS